MGLLGVFKDCHTIQTTVSFAIDCKQKIISIIGVTIS